MEYRPEVYGGELIRVEGTTRHNFGAKKASPPLYFHVLGSNISLDFGLDSTG